MGKHLIEIGKIFTTFGLNGEVKIYPYADREIFEAFEGKDVWIDNGDLSISVKIKNVKRSGKSYLVKLKDFNTLNKSKRIVGKFLCVEEEKLPAIKKDEYYFYQIIGVEVYDENDEFLGKVKDVIQTGANDVFVVKNGEKEMLVPSVKDYVLNLDLENSRMIVKKMVWY